MKTWFIPRKLIEQQKSSGRGFRLKGKTIELYNKNMMCWYRFKNARPCMDRIGYLVERMTCPRYFRRVIAEVAP